MNIVKVSEEYGEIDISIDIKEVLDDYFTVLMERKEWKDIFSKFEIEFKVSKEYITTINKEKISLIDSILLEDGSIMIDSKKVYSSR
jgi:BirA family biotin operon repressor/biotin-[acetyl-CoA-carboxylase] ligase